MVVSKTNKRQKSSREAGGREKQERLGSGKREREGNLDLFFLDLVFLFLSLFFSEIITLPKKQSMEYPSEEKKHLRRQSKRNVAEKLG